MAAPGALAAVTELSSDTGAPGDFVTTVASQTVRGTFTGTLAAGERIQVSADGTAWVDATANAATWSATGVTLSPGTGMLSVRTIDVAANTTAGAGHAYTLDLPSVSIGPASITRVEGNAGIIPYTFTVTLDQVDTASHTVDWSISGGSATASDFSGGVLPSGTLTFPAGQTSQTIIVNVTGDLLVESDESFLVTLSAPSSGLTIGTASATGSIVNDDGSLTEHGVNNDAYIILQGHQLVAPSSTGVLFNDEGTTPQSAAYRAGPDNGLLHFNSDGSFDYSALASFSGIDSFSYEASAGGTVEATNALIYVVPTNIGATTTLDVLALTTEEQIAVNYTAFLGRGADADGFEFWVDQYAINQSQMTPHELLEGIASSFAVSDEAKALYPFLDHPFDASDAEIQGFLDSVFDNLFNRTPDAAGLAYWTTQIKQTLAAGKFVGTILIDIVGGAQDTADGKDITTLMSKDAVNLDYVHQQQQHDIVWAGASDVAAATALLQPVTADPRTVLVGLNNVDALIAVHA